MGRIVNSSAMTGIPSRGFLDALTKRPEPLSGGGQQSQPRECKISEIAKEVSLPEPVELTEAEVSAVAGGAPGPITILNDVVGIEPSEGGVGPPPSGPPIERTKRIKSNCLVITMSAPFISS